MKLLVCFHVCLFDFFFNILLDDMGACRLYGSLNVNKVASNLHITSDGHGYASSGHTSHDCK